MPVSVRVQLTALSGSDPNVVAIVADRAKRVAEEARRRAPRDTGALANSITARVTRRGSVSVGTVSVGAPYGRYVHDGTGIYGRRGAMIRPRRAQFLSWVDRGTGNRVYARQVRGVPARPFLTDALAAVGLAGRRRS